jgi:hypothetical protein
MNLQATPLVPARPSTELHVPALIAGAGDRAALRFMEFFTVNIRNRNTRAAYARACRRLPLNVGYRVPVKERKSRQGYFVRA